MNREQPQQVWLIMTRLRALPHSDFPGSLDAEIWAEPRIPERDIELALGRLRVTLAREGYELMDVTRCVRYDLDAWDEDNGPVGGEMWELVSRVVEARDVELGPIYFDKA